jgi:hypothetical protein
MGLFTKLTTITELQNFIVSLFISKAEGKADKVAPAGVLSAIFYAIAVIGQKAIREIATVESKMFIENAYGGTLDEIAKQRGVPARLGQVGSSTYIALRGNAGTFYDKNVCIFKGGQFDFELTESVTLDSNGFAYAKVSCLSVGELTNVNPSVINSVNPIPTGHIAVWNEYKATGGRNIEGDDLFRNRIINYTNITAQSTRLSLTERLRVANNKVSRVWFAGRDANGKQIIKISAQNQSPFSNDELLDMYNSIKNFLTISDSFLLDSTSQNVLLQNCQYKEIDIELRADLDSGIDSDTIRINMQKSISRLFDHNYWDLGKTIQWENILVSCSNVSGVRFIESNYMKPRADIHTNKFELPVVRSFVLKDTKGNIISSNNGSITPFYYPAR